MDNKINFNNFDNNLFFFNNFNDEDLNDFEYNDIDNSNLKDPDFVDTYLQSLIQNNTDETQSNNLNFEFNSLQTEPDLIFSIPSISEHSYDESQKNLTKEKSSEPLIAEISQNSTKTNQILPEYLPQTLMQENVYFQFLSQLAPLPFYSQQTLSPNYQDYFLPPNQNNQNRVIQNKKRRNLQQHNGTPKNKRRKIDFKIFTELMGANEVISNIMNNANDALNKAQQNSSSLTSDIHMQERYIKIKFEEINKTINLAKIDIQQLDFDYQNLDNPTCKELLSPSIEKIKELAKQAKEQLLNENNK